MPRRVLRRDNQCDLLLNAALPLSRQSLALAISVAISPAVPEPKCRKAVLRTPVSLWHGGRGQS